MAPDRPPSQWAVPGGWTLRYRAATGSTNDDAKRAVLAGCADRTVFLADVQRSGRGRYGRQWIAPAGSSLLFSVALLHTAVDSLDLTALCSLSVVDAIRATTGLAARIKWPNDVMMGDRKVCGILTEVVWKQQEPATVVGIGLNVNVDLASAGLPPTATSLSAELGRTCPREQVFTAILGRVDEGLSLDAPSLVPIVRRRWEELLWRRKQVVRVADGDRTLEGIVESLSPSRALLLRDETGVVHELTTAELLF